MTASIKRESLQCKSVHRLTNKFFDENSTENEKWVYFAIARRWRKVGPGLFRK